MFGKTDHHLRGFERVSPPQIQHVDGQLAIDKKQRLQSPPQIQHVDGQAIDKKQK